MKGQKRGRKIKEYYLNRRDIFLFLILILTSFTYRVSAAVLVVSLFPPKRDLKIPAIVICFKMFSNSLVIRKKNMNYEYYIIYAFQEIIVEGGG